jgi:AcrR family transcriptional regulator
MTVNKRTRLSPQARRMQLLDCAAEIIQELGLSNFTMDALASHAGVSNPLIYKYFDTRLELLQELLKREYDRFSSGGTESLQSARTYEDIVTVVVTMNFDEARKGNILRILAEQPDIRVVIEAGSRDQQRKVGVFLVERMAEAYPLTRKQAERLLIMASGASQAAAASRFNIRGRTESQLIAQTVRFIMGGLESLLAEGVSD